MDNSNKTRKVGGAWFGSSPTWFKNPKPPSNIPWWKRPFGNQRNLRNKLNTKKEAWKKAGLHTYKKRRNGTYIFPKVNSTPRSIATRLYSSGSNKERFENQFVRQHHYDINNIDVQIYNLRLKIYKIYKEHGKETPEIEAIQKQIDEMDKYKEKLKDQLHQGYKKYNKTRRGLIPSINGTYLNPLTALKNKENEAKTARTRALENVAEILPIPPGIWSPADNSLGNKIGVAIRDATQLKNRANNKIKRARILIKIKDELKAVAVKNQTKQSENRYDQAYRAAVIAHAEAKTAIAEWNAAEKEVKKLQEAETKRKTELLERLKLNKLNNDFGGNFVNDNSPDEEANSLEPAQQLPVEVPQTSQEGPSRSFLSRFRRQASQSQPQPQTSQEGPSRSFLSRVTSLFRKKPVQTEPDDSNEDSDSESDNETRSEESGSNPANPTNLTELSQQGEAEAHDADESARAAEVRARRSNLLATAGVAAVEEVATQGDAAEEAEAGTAATAVAAPGDAAPLAPGDTAAEQGSPPSRRSGPRSRFTNPPNLPTATNTGIEMVPPKPKQDGGRRTKTKSRKHKSRSNRLKKNKSKKNKARKSRKSRH